MDSIYLLSYLGSAILANGQTGLSCIQKPLHELYSLFHQYGLRVLQDRRLIISLDGISFLFKESGQEKYLHNKLAFVHGVQLLKFFYEQRNDKKLYGAFLPAGKCAT